MITGKLLTFSLLVCVAAGVCDNSGEGGYCGASKTAGTQGNSLIQKRSGVQLRKYHDLDNEDEESDDAIEDYVDDESKDATEDHGDDASKDADEVKGPTKENNRRDAENKEGGDPCKGCTQIQVRDDRRQKIPVNYWVNRAGGPIVIHFHGVNGKARTSIPKELKQTDMCFFAGSALKGSWGKHNIVDWVSTMVDVAADVEGCDVSKGVTVSGYSMGCAQLHRIFVQNRDTRIARFACNCYQLMDGQYQDGLFQIPAPGDTRPAPDCDWVPADPQPLKGRIFWDLLGEKDSKVPFRGKAGRVKSGEESAYIMRNYLGEDNFKMESLKAGHVLQPQIWDWVAELVKKTNVPVEA